MKKTALILFVIICETVFAGEYNIRSICVKGNSVTKESVILRECEFSINDSIDIHTIEKLINRSRYNLLNTSLFNFVEITYTVNKNEIDISILVTERWYYWIYPILEQADRNLSSYIYYADWDKYNYGLAFDKQNFLGLNHLLKLKLRLGYREHYSFYYVAPEIGEQKKHGLWFGTDYFRQKQVQADIFYNKPFYYSSNEYIFNQQRLEAGYSYRSSLYSVLKVRLMYEKYKFADTLSLINTQWSNNNEIHNYIYPQIKFVFDNRDNANYPLKGIKVFADSRLPTIHDKSLSGSFFNTAGIEINSEIAKKLYHRASIFGFICIHTDSEKKSPYYFHINPNYNHIIRGYDYYYLYSTEFFSFTNTISFVLSDYKEHNIPFIKNEKFGRTFSRVYLNAFIDIARTGKYLNDNPTNSMNNTFIASVGLGLAIETYYDRVLEIRFAYNEHINNFGIFVDYRKTILNAF